MILILGCPRSGTSYISSICESFGYNFNIDNNNQLNLIYKPDVNYYQLKNLHFKLMSTDVNFFNNIKNFDFSEYLDYEIIKEPYLLFVLSSIVKYVDKIILIIRNPKEVKESWINFIKINNSGNLTQGMTDKYIYDKWEKYYITFLENILENNFDNYHIVNYNNISTDTEINNLSNFLEIDNKNNKIEINFKNNCNFDDLSGCPATTKYLYISILNSKSDSNSSSNDITKTIIENYYKLKKNGIKPNEKCICNSGKKYKKCCNL